MWQALETLLQQPSTMLFVIIIIILISFLVQKGIFRYNAHGVQIGKAHDNERDIILKQIQHIENSVDAVKLPVSDIDYYHTKYVMSSVKLLLIKAVTYNHIKDDDIYISLKQEEVYNTIQKRTTNEYFQTSEFKEYSYAWVKDLVKDLVKIRKYYIKEVI